MPPIGIRNGAGSVSKVDIDTRSLQRMLLLPLSQMLPLARWRCRVDLGPCPVLDCSCSSTAENSSRVHLLQGRALVCRTSDNCG